MLPKSTQKSSELSRGPRHRLFQSPLRHTWQLEMMIEEVSKKMRLTEVNCSDLWVTSCSIHWLKAITLHHKVAGNGLRWEMVISSAVTQGRDWYLGPWVMGSHERMKWCDKFLNAVWYISLVYCEPSPLKGTVATMEDLKLDIWKNYQFLNIYDIIYTAGKNN